MAKGDYKIVPGSITDGGLDATAAAEYRAKLAGLKNGGLVSNTPADSAVKIASKSTAGTTQSAMQKAQELEKSVKDGIKVGADSVKSGLNTVGGLIGSGVSSVSDAIKGIGSAFSSKGDSADGTGESTDNKPGIKPTKNVFVTDGNAELKAIDPYDESGANPINSLKDSVSGVGDSVKGALKTAKEYIKVGQVYVAKGRAIYQKGMQYKRAYDAINNGKGSMINRIIGNNKLIKGALNDAGYGDVSDNSITKWIDSNAPTMLKYENAYYQVKTANLNDQRQVANLLNRYSTDKALFDFKDMGADVALGARLVNDATRYGIPNSFSTVVSTFDNSKAIQGLANASLPAGITYSDFKLVEDINRTLGDAAVLSSNPNIVRQFSEAYNRPWNSPAGQDRNNYNNVIGMYKQVDPGWNTSTRVTSDGPQTVVDFSKLNTGSAEFISMVESGAQSLPKDVPLEERLLAMMRHMPARTVRSDIARHWPDVVVNKAQQSTQLVVSPIVLAT